MGLNKPAESSTEVCHLKRDNKIRRFWINLSLTRKETVILEILLP